MARKNTGRKRQLPNGRWCVTVTHGYRSDGSRRTLSRVVDTEEEADSAIVKLRSELGASPAAGERVTLDDYFWGVFLPRKQSMRVKATSNSYRTWYRQHVAPTFGDRYMTSITSAEIRAWVAGLPPKSAQNYVKCLRAVLRSAWEDGLLPSEPMRARLDMPTRDTRPEPVWDAETVSEALSRLRGADVEPLVLVMVGAGLSASEARARDWADLSEDCSTITVYSAYTEQDGIKGPKNSRRYRTVPVLPVCAERLRKLRGEGPICVNRRKQRMGPKTVPKRWRALWDDGTMDGIPWLKMNRLRATHETLMLVAGVPDALNSALHGHSQKIAYSNYLAPVTAEATSAAMAVNDLITSRKTTNLRFVD